MTERERLGPPPVEPLSDVAWSRVERGLWSRLDEAQPAAPAPARSPRRWVWIAAPVAAAAAVAIALGVRGGDAVDEVQPARVVSGAAPTSLLFGDVHVALDADSAIVMNRESRALLERGAAAFAVPPRGERSPFVVAAGDAIVRVIGTQFRVARAHEDISVEVQRGVVEVQFRGIGARVAAGQRWASRQPAVVESIDQTAARAQPPVAAPPRPAIEEPPAPEPPKPDQAGEAKPPKQAPKPKSAAVKPAKPAPQPDSSESEFRRLEALEPHDPSAAITGYLEIAHGRSAWAAPALFAAARLSADRAEPRAPALLQRYLQRYPRGPNAADAQRLLTHLQSR